MQKFQNPSVIASQSVPSLRTLYLLSLSLIVLCLIPFSQVLNFKFLNFDDGWYVFENAVVRSGLSWDGMKWAFTSLHGGNWHPITSIFMMAEVSLFGVSAKGFHAVNLLLHIVNAILLFIILSRATKLIPPAFFVACLFAVHPTRAESVAWIVELKDVLSTLFAFWAILLYVKHGKASKLSIFVVFILSLMSKQMYVTLPVFMLILDFWPLKRFSREKLSILVLEKIPYFIASLIASKIVLGVHLASGSLSPTAYPLALRLKSSIVSYGHYIFNMVTLKSSGFFNPYAENIPISLWLPILLTLFSITIAVYIFRKKGPYLLSGWLLFIVSLLPVVGIVQTGIQAMADRFTYFSYIGLLVMIFYFLYAQLNTSTIGRRLFTTGGIVISILAAIACHTQTSYWKDSRTLFQYAVDVNPQNYLAHFKLGSTLYYDEGKNEEAKAHILESIKLLPNFSEGNNVLGQILSAEGNEIDAEKSYKISISIKPNDESALANLATLYLKTGKYDLALEYFRRAIQINSNLAQAYSGILQYAKKTCGLRPTIEAIGGIALLKTSSPQAAVTLIDWYEQLKGDAIAEKEQSCKELKQLEEIAQLSQLTQTLKDVQQAQQVYKIY